MPIARGSYAARTLLVHFVDTNQAVVDALRRQFERFPEVEVSRGDITAMASGVVVSPANSHGFMDGGVDKLYSAFFGPSLTRAVRDAVLGRPEGLLPVGAAVAVATGHSRIHHVIIAPTMEMPEHVPASHAYRALRAALRLMSEDESLGEALYSPGLTTLVGGVAPELAAAEMSEAYADFKLARG